MPDKIVSYEDETHTYKILGRRVPGVTEILMENGMIDLYGIPVNVLEHARALGTEVHEVCRHYDENILRMETVDPNIRPYLDGWIEFIKDLEVKIFSIETIIYSVKWGYAGRLDRIADIAGAWSLLDLKSTTTMSPAVPVQMGLYKKAWEEMTGRKIKNRWAVQLFPEKENGKLYKIWPYKELSDESVGISALQMFKWREKFALNKGGEYEREIFSY